MSQGRRFYKELITVLKEDFIWFVDNYQKLYSKYGNSFLAIKDKTVLGSYDSYAEGVHKTAETHPLGTFIIQQCNGSASAYTAYIASTDFSS